MWLQDRHTDGRTDRCRTKWSLCAAMLRRRHNDVECLLLWKFWIYIISQRILGRIFVGIIVNIRNECLFSGFMGNESEYRTNKLPKICLFHAPIHSPWTQKKKTFLKWMCIIQIHVGGKEMSLGHQFCLSMTLIFDMAWVWDFMIPSFNIMIHIWVMDNICGKYYPGQI